MKAAKDIGIVVMENANQARDDQAKVSKAHLKIKLKQLNDALTDARAAADRARKRARRTIQAQWRKDEEVRRIERRTSALMQQIASM